jgi:hypothetical protein
MNCREFDLLVIDWVRGVALDARTLLEAETHAAACDRCRDRLAGERALTASLELLANSAAGSETPANVEDLLRTVFREQIAARQPRPAVWHLKNRWPMAARRQLGRMAWAGATAAVVVAGVLLWMSRDRGAAPPETQPRIAEVAPVSGEQSSGEQASEEQPRVIALPPETPPPMEQPPSPLPAARRGDSEQLATVQSQEEPTPGDSAAGNALVTVREVTTEFLPFPYAEGLSAGERIQLIHVRLPGEALTLFGLPSAVDPSATVPADVLLGQDGTARAVRFVRFTGSTGAAGGSHY